MNEYSAISPIMNDQWSGKTLFSCVRIGPASCSRSSTHLAGLALRRARLVVACAAGVAVVVMDAPRSRGRSARGSRCGRRSTAGRHRRSRRPIGSFGRLRVAGPNTGLASCEHLELRLVARAEQARGLLLVQRGRAAGVRADLGEGDVLRVVRRPAEAGLALAGLDRLAGRSRMMQRRRRRRGQAVEAVSSSSRTPGNTVAIAAGLQIVRARPGASRRRRSAPGRRSSGTSSCSARTACGRAGCPAS